MTSSGTDPGPASGVALWRQVADAIRLDIVGGKLNAGDKLAGELPLAERFGVNRHTVRRALAVLAEEGVVRAEQGRGTFVATRSRSRTRVGPVRTANRCPCSSNSPHASMTFG